MSFPPAFLEEIRNRLPLSGVVGSRMRLTRAGREFKGCCPFHNEKTPSFYINDDKQFFHCFGCGAHGDVIGFTMRNDRLSFPEAIESLAAQAGLQVPRDTPMEREKFDSEKRLFMLLDRVTGWFEEQLFSPAGRDALAYLKGRGLSDEAIRRFRIGFAPNDGQLLLRKITAEGYKLDELMAVGLAKKAEDRPDHYSFFRNRVIFPVGDRRGRTVAFGARIMGDGEPKYLNSPDHSLFHKGKLLYGLSRARAALGQGQPLIVVEGYMDVIALAEAGYTGAVAPLGTALTEDQIQTLWKLLPSTENREPGRDYSPILCFDGDNAGQRAAQRAVERVLPLLTPAQTIRIATMAGAKDPDELIRHSGTSAFNAIIKQAQPMIEVLWSNALQGRNLQTPEERGAFAAILKSRTSQIKDEQLRHLYLNEFRKRLDDAFGWKPRTTSTYGKTADGRLVSKGQWKAPPPLNLTRRPPQSAQRTLEKILLALILNHPVLFDEFGESFAHMDFNAPEFNALHRQLVDILSQAHDGAPEAAELRRALADIETDPFVENRESSLLDEILSPETYLHAKEARPDASPDHARAKWLHIWQMIEQGKVRAEYNAVCALFRDQPTEENQRRMEALRSRVMTFDLEAGESLARGN